MSNTIYNIDEFKTWIKNNNLAKGKVVSDIASRAKRVAKIINIFSSDDLNMLIAKLQEAEDFQKLSPSVKSQLKKAIKLYIQFTNENV